MTHCYIRSCTVLCVYLTSRLQLQACYQLQAATNTSGVPGKHMKVVT